MRRTSAVVSLLVVLFAVLILVPLLGAYLVTPGDTDDGGSAAVGPTGTDEPMPTPMVTDTPSPVPTPTPTVTQTVTPTETATATPTDTQPPTTSVPPTSTMTLDGAQLAETLAGEINERRQDSDLQSLSTNGRTPELLTAMASGHSQNMSELGYATHYYQGNNSADRYKVRDIYSRCRFASNSGGYLVTPDRDQLELIGVIEVAGYLERHRNPDAVYEAVAETLVQRWFESDAQAAKLEYENAEMMGSGAVITDDRAYVAVTLC